MKLTVLTTSIGLGQIFDPAPIEYESLGQIVKRVLEASTPDLVLQVTGKSGGIPVPLAEASSFHISTIQGADGAALKGESTHYAIGDLAGRTTYDLNAHLSLDDTDLGSLGLNSDSTDKTLSILSLSDGFTSNTHAVADVECFVIDQLNQRILMSIDGEFSGAANANVSEVATFSKGQGSFME